MHTDRHAPLPVLQAHPLLAVPVVAATASAGIAHGAAAGQMAFMVGGGAALAMDLTARRIVRAAWRRSLWPPSTAAPVALVVVAVGACWATGWSLVDAASIHGVGIDAGVRAAWIATVVQFVAWRRANHAGSVHLGQGARPHPRSSGMTRRNDTN